MLAHENYMRLISTPAPQPQYVKSSNGETFNTNNLYNSKPETERDYKNLISNIYNRAIQGSASSYQHQQPVNEQVQQIESVPYSAQSMSMASDKARVDGLKVNVSNTKSSMKNTTIVTTYDLGLTLFKCSAIVGIILFIEFLLCMVFKNGLGVSVAYPIVILMIGVALLAISGVLTLFGFGKNSTKPITNNYISISVVISIIIILIICVIAFLGVTDVNTLSAGNIMAKIVVPSITALTIPLFATSFYLFIK
jgi:hypothetical protein